MGRWLFFLLIGVFALAAACGGDDDDASPAANPGGGTADQGDDQPAAATIDFAPMDFEALNGAGTETVFAVSVDVPAGWEGTANRPWSFHPPGPYQPGDLPTFEISRTCPPGGFENCTPRTAAEWPAVAATVFDPRRADADAGFLETIRDEATDDGWLFYGKSSGPDGDSFSIQVVRWQDGASELFSCEYQTDDQNDPNFGAFVAACLNAEITTLRS